MLRLSGVALLMVAVLLPSNPSAAESNPLVVARQRVEAEGSYRFSTELVQVSTPAATVQNAGRSSETRTIRLEGVSDLTAAAMELEAWAIGDRGVPEGESIGLRIVDGVTYQRTTGGAWRASSGSGESLASSGDVLSVLGASRDVMSMGTEVLNGESVTRYGFTLDAEAFAAAMSSSAGTSAYTGVSGSGSLWIGDDGLPVRQSLSIVFPERSGVATTSEIAIDFSEYGSARVPGVAHSSGSLWSELSLPTEHRDVALFVVLGGLLLAAALVQRSEVTESASRGVRPATAWMSVAIAFALVAADVVPQRVDAASAPRGLELPERAMPDQSTADRARQAMAAQQVTTVDPHFDRLAVTPQIGNPSDTVTDTDTDGLTDFVEERLGIDSEEVDTDGDGIDDLTEVEGFSVDCAANTGSAVEWYSDPADPDSNRDGITDGMEWAVDTDDDCAPDVFDTDNDGDGVDDRIDAGTRTAVGGFGAETPMELSLAGLDSSVDRETLVEFQLRPDNAAHVRAARWQLDWPADQEGQVMDLNGSTDDLLLLPMLELTVPAAHVLPSEAQLASYNVQLGNSDDAGNQIVYVPLNVLKDPVSGEDVAFAGRMRYSSQASWAAAHQVRLVWVVQVANDLRCDPTAADAIEINCISVGTVNDTEAGYIFDVAQVIHVYADDPWTLTGLSVSEERGTETAVIYEDPAVAESLADHTPSWLLEPMLTERFLSTTPGTDTFEITNANIAGLLDRDATPGSTFNALPDAFQVRSVSSASFTEGIVETASMMDDVLEQVFTPLIGTEEFQPLITTASTTTFRRVSLDTESGVANVAGSQLTMTFPSAAVGAIESVGTVKWSPFCATGLTPSWRVCSLEEFLADLEQRSADDPAYDPENPELDIAVPDAVAAAGELELARLHAVMMTTGRSVSIRIATTDDQVLALNRSYETTTALVSQADIFSASGTLGKFAYKRIAGIFYLRRLAAAAQASATSTIQGLKYATAAPGSFAGISEAQAGPRLVKALKGLSTAKRVGVGLGIAAVIVAAATVAIYFGVNGEAEGVVRGLAVTGAAVGLALSAWQTSVAAQQLIATGGSVWAVFQSGSAQKYLGLSKGAAVVGALIAAGVTWGFFIYQMVDSSVDAWSPEFNAALAAVLADTLYIALLTILSLTIVGTVVVALVVLVDTFINAFCPSGDECATISSSASSALTVAIFGTAPMVDVNASDLLSVRAPTLSLVDPEVGYVQGNGVTVSLPVDTTIRHTDADLAWQMEFFIPLFSQDNIRSGNFVYDLSADGEVAPPAATSPGTWDSVTAVDTHNGHDLYEATRSETVEFDASEVFDFSDAGLNRSFEYTLNSSYTLPSYECWTIPIIIPVPFVPVCYRRSIDGTTSGDLPPLVYDVLPATFAEFVDIAPRSGGWALAWDRAFLPIDDLDSDGLLASRVGGLDLDDTVLDSDGDGLTDTREFELREAGYTVSALSADIDADGLSDLQELAAGTAPAVADTDNDGLTDGAEVRHEVTEATGMVRVAGGWDITVADRSVRVYSNPRLADSDGDGIGDKAEKQLSELADPSARIDDMERPYHPTVVNTSPIGVSVSSPNASGFVAPGDTVDITTSVTATTPLGPSLLDLSWPSSVGPLPAPARLDFDPSTFVDSQDRQQITSITIPEGESTIQVDADVRAWLPDGGIVDPVLSAEAGVPIAVAKSLMGANTYLHPFSDLFDQFRVLGQSVQNAGNRVYQQDVISVDPLAGSTTVIDNDADTTVSPARPDAASAFGGGATSGACNDIGNCMVIWDDRDQCSSVSFYGIKNSNIWATADAPEFGIFIDRYPGTASSRYSTQLDELELLWSGVDHGGENMAPGAEITGQSAVSNGFPFLTTICGEAIISVRELDAPYTEVASSQHMFSCDTTDCTDTSGLDGLRINYTTICNTRCTARTGWNYGHGFGTDGTNNPVNFSLTDDIAEIKISVSPNGAPHRLLSRVVGPSGVALSGPSQVFSDTVAWSESAIASDGLGFGAAWKSSTGQSFFGTFTKNGVAEQAGYPYQSFGNDLHVLWVRDRYVVISAAGTTRQVPCLKGECSTTYSSEYTAFDTATGRSMVIGEFNHSGRDASDEPQVAVHYDAQSDSLLVAGGAIAGTAIDGMLWPSFHSRLQCTSACNSVSPAELFAAGDHPSISIDPLTRRWLVSVVTPAGVSLGSFADDLSGGTRTVASSTENRIARLACPVLLPVAELRFEELPGTTAFVDSTGNGLDGEFVVGGGPRPGAPAAPDALGSRLSLRFADATESLTIPSPMVVGSDVALTMAFWVRVEDTSSSEPFVVSWDSTHELRVHPDTGVVDWEWGTAFASNSSAQGWVPVNDGEWHLIVASRPSFGTLQLTVGDGQRVWSAGGGAGDLPSLPSELSLRGGGSPVSIDQLQFFNNALSEAAVAQLIARSEPKCMVTQPGGTEGDLLKWWSVASSATDTRGGGLVASGGVVLRADGDAPVSTTSVPATALNASANSYILAGGASDGVESSGVANVEVSLDGGPWLDASGAASWTFEVPLTDGNVSIRTRATDAAGNVETPGPATLLLVDRVEPLVALDDPPSSLVPTRAATTGLLSVGLSGSASDAGSGVPDGGVEVSLVPVGEAVSPESWQAASLVAGAWVIDYVLPTSVYDVSESYAVRLRASDGAGNSTASDTVVDHLLLDNRAPTVSLDDESRSLVVLTGGVEIGGQVADLGGVGVASVDVSFTPIDQASGVSPVVPDWLPTTLGQPDGTSTSTTWGLAIPDGIEGHFQIDLRATDSSGNVRTESLAWRGLIDTAAPRLTFSVSPTGRERRVTQRVEIAYECRADDLFLDAATFSCPPLAAQPVVREFLEPSSLADALQLLFPDQPVLVAMSTSGRRWESSLSNDVQFTACDVFGNCSTEGGAVTTTVRRLQRAMTEGLVTWSAVAAPSAVIAAPAAGEHLATDSDDDVDIVVSLDAPASIKTIDVTLDGAVVATRAFTRGEVSLYEESITVSAAGLHEVRLSMTDWNDVVTDAEPIQFFADTAPPVLTVDDSDITLGRTWAVGTDFYRFSGTVVDDGTLASVQIKVNGSRWQEVSFGGGVWSTALHVPDADGSTLLVSVRAFDLAGRLSSVGSTPSVDLAPEQATPYVRPDTAIDSGPVATGAPASAVFRFSGIPGDSGVAGYTCQLDGFEAALCSDGVAFEDLAAGRHVLEVAAIDELGYVDLSPASWSWAVAAAGPQPQLLSKPARTTTQRAAEFTFTGGGRATFECALDEGAPEPCSSPYRVESLPNGRHTFRVWAAVGGSSGTAVSYTWSVINGAPVVEDQSAKVVQNDTIGRSLTLGVTDVDPVTFRIVEQPEHGYLEGIPPNVVYVPFREYVGPDQFTFEADDSQVVSNLGTVSVLVEAPDTDPPTITSPGDQTVRSAYPGTAPIEYRLPTAIDNSGPVSIECNPPSGTVFRPGATVVTCRAEDAAGNTAIVRFTIDHIVGDDDFTLPATGNGHLPLAEGFLLLVLGCALVFVARRRLVALLNGRR